MSETTNDMTSPISINITDMSNATVIEPTISNDDALLLQKQKIMELKRIRNGQIKEELVQVVCRQTDLTNDEARERLEKEQYNYMNVLNEYFGIKHVKTANPTTINQQIYGEIRTLMDTGAKSFRMEKERTEYIQKMNEQRNLALQSSNITNTEK